MNFTSIPVIGFAANSGTGKTTLLIRVLPILRARGVRVGILKHAHHGFEVDTPGKDSYQLRHAGAKEVLVASRQRWALMAENEREDEPSLEELLLRLDQDTLDVILVEGFADATFPKIELYRAELKHPVRYPRDNSIIALATDAELSPPTDLPVLDVNDPESVANFIEARIKGI